MRLEGSRGLFGWPRLSTVERSRGADLRALRGTLWECDGWVLEDRVGCPAAAVEVAPAEAGAPIVGIEISKWVGRSIFGASELRISIINDCYATNAGRGDRDIRKAAGGVLRCEGGMFGDKPNDMNRTRIRI
jgi:hypothetical protein